MVLGGCSSFLLLVTTHTSHEMLYIISNRAFTANTWLTVVCETKWDETKWKSVVCEMEICSLRNENL